MKNFNGKWAVAILTVAAIGIAIQMRDSESTQGLSSSGAEGKMSSGRPKLVKKFMRSLGFESAARMPAAATEKARDPKFREWVTVQARSLDLPKVDSAQIERELQSVIASLTSEQAGELTRMALNASALPRERILATYLLASAGTKASGALSEVIQTPMDQVASPAPHSQDEINNVREKSLRIMAIDALAQQARSDSHAREVLEKSIPGIQDPYVRTYAQEKLSEISKN